MLVVPAWPLGSRRGFNVMALFAVGAGGFLLDRLDPTLAWGADALKLSFQDQKNTAAAADGNVVGVQLERSLGVALGADLIVDGDFATAPGPWSLLNGTISAGALHFAAATGGSYAEQTLSHAALSFWRCLATIAGFGGGAIRFSVDGGGTNAGDFTANGAIVGMPRASAAGGTFQVRTGGASTTADVDDVSARLIAGNHFLQTTTAAKPTLRSVGGKWRLRGDGSDDGLFGSVIPGAAVTLIAAITPNAASAGADIAIGCADAASANRCQLGINDGVASGGWGAQSVTTITDPGALDLRNANSVIAMRADASTVDLSILKSDGSMLLNTYNAAASGSGSTTNALALLSNNANGTLGNAFYGDALAVAVKRRINDQQLIGAMKYMANQMF